MIVDRLVVQSCVCREHLLFITWTEIHFIFACVERKHLQDEARLDEEVGRFIGRLNFKW